MEPLPSDLFRAHANRVGPLEPAARTGAGRWDDYRRTPRYHVLYTAHSPEGALIERLQHFRGSDTETFEILDDLIDDEGDPIPLPERDTVPERLLRELAISHLKVLDGCDGVVDPCDLGTIDEMCALAPVHSVMDFAGPPPPKPADLLRSDYALSQRASVIVFHSQPRAAGIISASSLANPLGAPRVNYSLFRDSPDQGSALRAYVERRDTGLAISRYRDALEAALEYLHARPARPLNELADEIR